MALRGKVSFVGFFDEEPLNVECKVLSEAMEGGRIDNGRRE